MTIRKINVVQCDYCGEIEEIKITGWFNKEYWYPSFVYGKRQPYRWSTDWYVSKDDKLHLCPHRRREKDLFERIQGVDKETMLKEIEKELNK